jgi:hypothetical protein
MHNSSVFILVSWKRRSGKPRNSMRGNAVQPARAAAAHNALLVTPARAILLALSCSRCPARSGLPARVRRLRSAAARAAAPSAACPARAGRARLLASAAPAASRVPRPAARARSGPFPGIGMCVSHLRGSQLPRISDSCALAGRDGTGQRNWQTIAVRYPGRRSHAMTREPTNPDQWTSYRPCTGTL